MLSPLRFRNWRRALRAGPPPRPAPAASELSDAELLELLASTTEHDPCYRAVRECLRRFEEVNLAIAGGTGYATAERLSAAERVGLSRWLAAELEHARQRAVAWRQGRDPNV